MLLMMPPENKSLKTRPTYYLLLALFLLLPSCAPSLPLYLDVHRNQPYSEQGEEEAVLLVAPFSAEKAAASAIGELFSWQGSQKIWVDNKALSEGITAKIEENLARRGVPFRTISTWNGTIAGMQGIGNGRQAILGGTVRLLRITSTRKMLRTVATLDLKVDCHIGLPQRASLITRSVEVKQEKTLLVQNSKELENLLDEGLQEAADRLVGELNKALNTTPAR